MSYRTSKLASVLRQNLAEIIAREYPQLASSLISINHIDISPDLSWADTYCSCVLSEEEQEKHITFLQQQASVLRHRLSQRIYVKKLPALRFHSDQARFRSRRIDELLEGKN